jgi:hypothetical protein
MRKDRSDLDPQKVVAALRTQGYVDGLFAVGLH